MNECKELFISKNELTSLKNLLLKYGGEYTATKIIYRYALYYNNTYIVTTSNKNKYITLVKSFLDELKSCGVEVGKEWKDNNKLPLKKGNKKLEKTTIILNVGSATFCPSKNTGKCNVCGICYAANAERQYLNTLVYRLTQTVRFYYLPADEIAAQILRRTKTEYIRFNESGDVFDNKDIEKILQIAKICYKKKNLITYLYTAAGQQYKQYQTVYLKINISGIDYTAVPNLTDANAKNNLVCCGVCNQCLYCKFEFGKQTVVKYHGAGIPDGTGRDNRSVGVKYYNTWHRLYCYNKYTQIKKEYKFNTYLINAWDKNDNK